LKTEKQYFDRKVASVGEMVLNLPKGIGFSIFSRNLSLNHELFLEVALCWFL